MKILVTGQNGQVARSLVERAAQAEDIAVAVAGRPEFDLVDPAAIERTIAATDADVVVSAAAYTQVDRAEDEPGLARAVNALGAEAVARSAAARGLPVIHLSTDYVFSGQGTRAYDEEHRPDPASVYGATKLEGEQRVAVANPRHVILRTAWVYSPFGRNFVRTMIRLAAERDEISVVADQWGNPTSALDIAEAILRVARRLNADDGAAYGLYHFAGTGATSWSGLAEAVMTVLAREGWPYACIRPITTEQFPTRARRPANSRLSTRKFDAVFGWQAPDWQASMAGVVRRLVAEETEVAGEG